MATDTAERPAGIEERYTAATNATDLTVDPDRRGAADLLIASGLSQGWLGRALLHLQAEWDKCPKPRKWTDAEISRRARELPLHKGKPDVNRARVEAKVDLERKRRDVYLGLRTRADVLVYMTEWARKYGIDEDLLSPALFHWLSPTCPACDGVGTLPADYPKIGPTCHHCKGTKLWPRPLGAERIHNHIKDCVGRARAGIAGNQQRARAMKQFVRVR